MGIVAPVQSNLPFELCQIHIIAYWLVSTELEEQTGNIELQYMLR